MFNFSTGSLSTLKPAYDKFNKCDSDRQNRKKSNLKDINKETWTPCTKDNICTTRTSQDVTSHLCFIKQYCRPTDIVWYYKIPVEESYFSHLYLLSHPFTLYLELMSIYDQFNVNWLVNWNISLKTLLRLYHCGCCRNPPYSESHTFTLRMNLPSLLLTLSSTIVHCRRKAEMQTWGIF